MATDLTITQWTEILLNRKLTTELDLSIFQTLYSFEGHKAFASQIGVILGYKGKSSHGTLNLEIGKLYQIDPIKDLSPVCPNCHSMLHKQNPPLKIEELKNMIKKNT